MSPNPPLVVLIHGAWHDSWSWGPLRTALGERGFRSVAPDLPCDDPESGAAEYARAVLAAIEDEASEAENVVVVGHSLGGLTAPLVAAETRASALIFLCALLPQVGESLAGQREIDPTVMTEAWRERYLPRRIDGGATSGWPPELAREIFYHDCPDEVAHAATQHLRPQAARPIVETTPLTRWPDCATHYIFAKEDRVIDAAWVEANVPARLGISPLPMDGGHSPFLSRPSELADALADRVR